MVESRGSRWQLESSTTIESTITANYPTLILSVAGLPTLHKTAVVTPTPLVVAHSSLLMHHQQLRWMHGGPGLLPDRPLQPRLQQRVLSLNLARLSCDIPLTE